MASTSENNMFRRLIGDYGLNTLTDLQIASWLDDACEELTADFVDSTGASAPVVDFDVLTQQYKPEVIYKAAINYWWHRAAILSEKLSTTVGQASQQASEKWDRAMRMIETLQAHYDSIQALGNDVTIGNLSYFNKASLTRRGGTQEEIQRDQF